MNEHNGPEDERLRRLLDDAVADVEPRDSLDSIRSRTVVTPFRARRPWILGAGAAVVATAATVAAVAVMGSNPGTTDARDPGFADGSPTVAGTGEGSGLPAPDRSVAPSPTGESSQPGTSSDESSAATSNEKSAVPVYYVGETSRGPRLFREFHELPSSSEDPGVAIASALREALSAAPADADYGTDWPAGTTAEFGFDGVGQDGTWSVTLSNPDVDLHDRPAGMSEAQAQLAVEQLVYTLQAAAQDQARSPVQLFIRREGTDSNRTDAVLGVPASEPLAAGDPLDVLAQVWVIDPSEGAEVSVPFKVTGLANSFEANVQWELMQGDTVVKDGFTMAEEAFTMAPYSFMVRNVPPGDYTLVVHDEDASGGAEGAGVWKDTKNITVVR
jgi:hypothetical protein